MFSFYKFSKGRKSLPEGSSGWFPFTGMRDIIWWFVLKLNPNISSLPVQALLQINFIRQIKMWITWNIHERLACDTHCVSQDSFYSVWSPELLDMWECCWREITKQCQAPGKLKWERRKTSLALGKWGLQKTKSICHKTWKRKKVFHNNHNYFATVV